MVTIHNSKGFFTIREATVADLKALVDIHVISWNATYPTYFPKPTHALREHQWIKAFAEKEDNWFCYKKRKTGGYDKII